MTVRPKPKSSALSPLLVLKQAPGTSWVYVYGGRNVGASGSPCHSRWRASPSRWPTSTNEKPETDNWDAWAAQPSLTVPSAGQLRQRSAFTPATATGSSPSPVLGQVTASMGAGRTSSACVGRTDSASACCQCHLGVKPHYMHLGRLAGRDPVHIFPVEGIVTVQRMEFRHLNSILNSG